MQRFRHFEPGLGALLPDMANDHDAIAAASGPTLARFWQQFEQGEPGAIWDRIQLAVGDPYLYFGAVDRGLIAPTLAGLTTLAALLSGGGPKVATLPADAQGAWNQFIRDYLAVMPRAQAQLDALIAAAGSLANASVRYGSFPGKQLMLDALAGKNDALPIATANLDARNAVFNEVTKVWVPKAEVLFYGPLPDGQIKLQTASGTWTWPGPTYVTPTAQAVQDGGTAIYVLSDATFGPGVGGPIRSVVAQKFFPHWTDGSDTETPWASVARFVTEAGLRAGWSGYPGSSPASAPVIPAKAIYLWSTTTQAMKDAIARDLGGLPTPDYGPAPTPPNVIAPESPAMAPPTATVAPTSAPPPGVPPIETSTGALVSPPSFVVHGNDFASDDATTTPPNPATALTALGGVGLALAGVALLWLLAQRRNRR